MGTVRGLQRACVCMCGLVAGVDRGNAPCCQRVKLRAVVSGACPEASAPPVEKGCGREMHGRASGARGQCLCSQGQGRGQLEDTACGESYGQAAWRSMRASLGKAGGYHRHTRLLPPAHAGAALAPLLLHKPDLSQPPYSSPGGTGPGSPHPPPAAHNMTWTRATLHVAAVEHGAGPFCCNPSPRHWATCGALSTACACSRGVLHAPYAGGCPHCVLTDHHAVSWE